MDIDMSSEPQPTRLSRITGCLLAGAVGDALGAVVEFSCIAEIRRTFGEQGIREYSTCYGQLGRFTDDTQMTLFTAEGVVLCDNMVKKSSMLADGGIKYES